MWWLQIRLAVKLDFKSQQPVPPLEKLRKPMLLPGILEIRHGRRIASGPYGWIGSILF